MVDAASWSWAVPCLKQKKKIKKCTSIPDQTWIMDKNITKWYYNLQIFDECNTQIPQMY